MIKIFSRLFKFFVGLSTLEQVDTNQYCRNWNGVDHRILPKLYDWISDNHHFINEKKCPLECLDYQDKTQRYFNASSISPYPVYMEAFSDLCTIPCLPNEACRKQP